MCIGVIEARFETEPRFFLPSSNNNNKSNRIHSQHFHLLPFVIDPPFLRSSNIPNIEPKCKRIDQLYVFSQAEIPCSREEAKDQRAEEQRAGWATIVRI